jgi:hypothetical protein
MLTTRSVTPWRTMIGSLRTVNAWRLAIRSVRVAAGASGVYQGPPHTSWVSSASIVIVTASHQALARRWKRLKGEVGQQEPEGDC